MLRVREEFGYRIVDNQVISYPIIDAGTTISREDGTFGFVYVNFNLDFTIFNAELQAEIKAVHNSTGLRLNNEEII